MEFPDPYERLVHGLKRAFDAYLAQPGPTPDRPVPVGRLERKPLFGAPEDRLWSLITAELGDWHDLARSAAEANANSARAAMWDRSPYHQFSRGVPPLEIVCALLSSQAAAQGTMALAKRVAAYMAGPPERLWQYIAVSMTPAFPVKVFADWEIAPIDLVNDTSLPFVHQITTIPFSPQDFHFYHHYGALRHPSGDLDVPAEDSEGIGQVQPGDQLLAVPLLALNLASDHPVHAGISYYVEPGKDLAAPPGHRKGELIYSVPKELQQWDNLHREWVQPRTGRILSVAETELLSKFLPELGKRIICLDNKQRERLILAANQYLIVAHRTPGSTKEVTAVPSMHEAEAAFRWISAIEGLLADASHADLSRKTAQRAAILVGHNDQDRLATHKLIKKAYNARSAYTHLGNPNSVEPGALRTITRKIIVSWIILAAEIPRNELAETLDNALLSTEVLENRIRRPLSEFWEQATPGSLPARPCRGHVPHAS